MVKKINKFGATVHTLLNQGYSQSWIAHQLNVKRQRVNYWASHPLKSEQVKKKKLPDKYISKIIELASNKPTSTMSSSRITRYINLVLKRDKLDMTISKSTVCRILKNEFGKPRKIRKLFYLNQKQKEQRLKFCKMILKRGITGDQIFFSDETKIEMGAYIHDYIRLTEDNKDKLKKGDEEVYKLINREQKKFELSIMVAGGICSSGLSNLVVIDGSENEFAYAQTLLYYKDDFNRLKKTDLYFEQDGATPHTSDSNKKLIDTLFGENKLLQNPPNSPDLAYPIESIWAYIKPRIKKRDPKNIEELKQYTIEEWNAIPLERIKNCAKNYLRRIKKVIEIKGGRLEECHLKEIREEANNEDNLKESAKVNEKEKKEKQEKQVEKRENLKLKIAYNDIKLLALRKKEVAGLKKKINNIKNKLKDEKKKN